MRRSMFPAAALLAAAFSLTACAGVSPEGDYKSFTAKEFVDFFFPDTPGERDAKIEELASYLRTQPGYPVGKKDGSAFARGDASGTDLIVFRDRPSPYHAEAVTRLAQREPAFARQYREGFLDGYRATYGAGRGQSAYETGRESIHLLFGGLPDGPRWEAINERRDSDPEYDRLFQQGRDDVIEEINRAAGEDSYSMGGPGGDGGDGGGP